MSQLQLSFFRADVTPPLGYPLCAGWYRPAEAIADRLFANGIILFPEDDRPIVLCALDWAELSNGEYNLWRRQLARAAGTSEERVTIHCIHAHDSPWNDRDAQGLLDDAGFPGTIMRSRWADEVLAAVTRATAASINERRPVTAIRSGRHRVHEIASNRRVMGDDGRVRGIRWTRCRDAALRAAPEGSIDPWLKTISFWEGDRKLVALHYYAVHPTSYDQTGHVTSDFVGIARERLSAREGVPHIYFTECAGDITPGKYNDGVTDNRELFTNRILDAMVASEKKTRPHAVGPVDWRVESVILPPRADHLEQNLIATLHTSSNKARSRAALILAYRRRCKAKIPLQVTALHLGDDLLSIHTPGESFIAYQLYAQELRPDACVVVPSYADCGPGYVTLSRSFQEGGYEPNDSFCSPQSEAILREAIRNVAARRVGISS